MRHRSDLLPVPLDGALIAFSLRRAADIDAVAVLKHVRNGNCLTDFKRVGIFRFEFSEIFEAAHFEFFKKSPIRLVQLFLINFPISKLYGAVAVAFRGFLLNDGAGTFENFLRIARILGMPEEIVNATDPLRTPIGKARAEQDAPKRVRRC